MDASLHLLTPTSQSILPPLITEFFDAHLHSTCGASASLTSLSCLWGPNSHGLPSCHQMDSKFSLNSHTRFLYLSRDPTSGLIYVPVLTSSFSCKPLQCSCLENPRDREAWWAAVYGVAQSWTQLKRLSSSSSRGWNTVLTDLCILSASTKVPFITKVYLRSRTLFPMEGKSEIHFRRIYVRAVIGLLFFKQG